MKLEIVLKLIGLGPKGGNLRNNNQKVIRKEIEIGMMIAKECEYLVSYSEIFEWGDYFCIKMEYFENGDLETQFNKNRIFTEEVFLSFLFFILFYFIFFLLIGNIMFYIRDVRSINYIRKEWNNP
jgi:serine/threonine protein kinase